MKKSIQVFSNLLFFGILFSIIFLITYVLSSNLTLKKLDMASSGYVTTHAISFTIDEDIHVTSIELAQVLEPTNYLFQRYGVQLEDLAVFSYGEGVQFDIIEGRQFTIEDLTQYKELKMMGNEKIKETPPGNWMQIATLGIRTPSLLDYISITLPSAANREYLPQGIWVIDGKSNVEKSFDNIVHRFGVTRIQRIPTEEIGHYRINGENRSFNALLYAVFFCCLLSYLPVTSYWIQCRNELYQLTYILGISEWKLACYILGQLLPLTISGFVSGMAVCIMYLAPRQDIEWSALAMAFSLSLFIALSAAYLLFHFYLTHSATE